MIKLLIAGDFVPGEEAVQRMNLGDYGFLDSFSSIINETDYSIVNFESPVVTRNAKAITKSGPNLSTSEESLKCLASIGFKAVTLANNHFYDYGQIGVEDTIEACKTNHIDYVGGGVDFQEARKVLRKTINDQKLAIINVCEHEYSIANSSHGGSNPLDLIQLHREMGTIRGEVDYLLVIIHGGIEHYHYPTPRMKKLYRHIVDLGADAVLNHHQHCINGYEIYKGKPIFYGLGNFFFPWVGKRPVSWEYGYVVKLVLDDFSSFELIPYKQTDEGVSLCEKDSFFKEMDLYNGIVQDDSLLQKKFDEYVLKNRRSIEMQLLPTFMRGRVATFFIRRGLFGDLFYGKQVYALKNRFTCESHHDTIRHLFSLITK